MHKLHSDRKRFFDHVIEAFSSDRPVFLSRVGGSDTDALLDYLRAKELGSDALEKHVAEHLPVVEQLNGFYDRSNGRVKSYFRYLDVLSKSYDEITMATFVHHFFLQTYFPSEIHDRFKVEFVPNESVMDRWVKALVSRDSFIAGYPYTYIENLINSPYTLFRALSHVLKEKSVLVICPFGESVMLNFKHRHSFFKEGYEYPDFKLDIVNTPITYRGLDPALYPNIDWFHTVDDICRNVAAKSFDIALLSCGSYAMPVGEFIKNKLSRKAIYVGGILQLFFGIIGRRYENEYFTSQINREYFIQPVEREKYLGMLPSSADAAREAFGAYF